jgi:hypothetical protein
VTSRNRAGLFVDEQIDVLDFTTAYGLAFEGNAVFLWVNALANVRRFAINTDLTFFDQGF